MSYYIYKICCDDLPDFIYVGSTKAFRSRKCQHKYEVNNTRKNTLLYTTIRENSGWDNFRMVCIEECDETIDSRRKVEAKEEEWRLKLKANMNTYRCHLNDVERKKQQQETVDRNRDKIKERKREAYKNRTEEQIDKERQRNRERTLNMTEEQREKERQRGRDKYHRNKDKVMEYKKQRIVCSCGRELRIDGLSRHRKTFGCE